MLRINTVSWIKLIILVCILIDQVARHELTPERIAILRCVVVSLLLRVKELTGCLVHIIAIVLLPNCRSAIAILLLIFTVSYVFNTFTEVQYLVLIICEVNASIDSPVLAELFCISKRKLNSFIAKRTDIILISTESKLCRCWYIHDDTCCLAVIIVEWTC